jgi:hypothetical protein
MATRSTNKKPPAKAPAKKAPPFTKKGGGGMTRCPECGGPIKNGVCQKCGYRVK